MTEQPQSRIDTALGILMDIPAASRSDVLTLAKHIADMETGEREELERTFERIRKWAPNKIVRKPEGAVPQKRKRGPKPVTAVA